jgi:hypothetical protein
MMSPTVKSLQQLILFFILAVTTYALPANITSNPSTDISSNSSLLADTNSPPVHGSCQVALHVKQTCIWKRPGWLDTKYEVKFNSILEPDGTVHWADGGKEVTLDMKDGRSDQSYSFDMPWGYKLAIGPFTSDALHFQYNKCRFDQ